MFCAELLHLYITFMQGLCPFSGTISSKCSSALISLGSNEEPTCETLAFSFFFPKSSTKKKKKKTQRSLRK